LFASGNLGNQTGCSIRFPCSINLINAYSIIVLINGTFFFLSKNKTKQKEEEEEEEEEIKECVVLFTDIGDGGKDGKGKEVAKDTEDELVDPNIKGHFGYHMVPSVE
jgi:hypothetical protein